MTTTNVSVDALTAALITQIATLVAPTITLTTARPLRSVQRYIADEFKDPEAFRRGIAGRSPAVRVRIDGQESLQQTTGRTRERVETTFGIVCASDNHRTPGGRNALMSGIELIRHNIVGRMFALPIAAFRSAGIRPLRDDEQLLAFTLVVKTRHWTDYTKQAAYDAMASTNGRIGAPALSGNGHDIVTVDALHISLPEA